MLRANLGRVTRSSEWPHRLGLTERQHRAAPQALVPFFIYRDTRPSGEPPRLPSITGCSLETTNRCMTCPSCGYPRMPQSPRTSEPSLRPHRRLHRDHREIRWHRPRASPSCPFGVARTTRRREVGVPRRTRGWPDTTRHETPSTKLMPLPSRAGYFFGRASKAQLKCPTVLALGGAPDCRSTILRCSAAAASVPRTGHH